MSNIRPSSDITIDAMLARPGMLVAPGDLAAAGIVTSYSTLKRWRQQGLMPDPVCLPGMSLKWRAGDVLAALGLAEVGR